MKLPKLPRPSRLHFYVNLSVGICFLLAIFGCLRAAGTLSAKYPDTNECDNTGSRTAVERQFQINLVIASGLSFAQAKILDLVWDIAIAQGGRLLHGWILYHVTCHALTWSLERSSLPYPFLLNLFLWPDSVFSFWSSVSYLGRDKRPLALLAVTFAYAIAHVLFLSAVWSAATGYQTPGTIAYAMPDGSWVAKDNDTLRLCWALKEPKRLPLGSQVSPDGVILGPTFGSHLRSFTDLDSTFASGGIWDFIPRLAANVSDDFYNIYSYARSKNSLRTFLRDPGLWISSSSRPDTVITWNATRLQQFSWFDDFNPRGFTELDYNSRNRFQPGGDMKPTIIEGWQFLGVQQNLSVRAEELFWITHTFGEHSKQGRFGEDKEHQPDTQVTQFLHSTFHLNISSSTLAQDAIPYNSTISFNGTTISLEAPFLNFVSCPWINPVLDECLCYKGQPLTQDFRQDSRKLCISGQGYLWGFSRSLVLIGLLLEVVWCYVCITLYLLSRQRSELIRRGKPTSGTVRIILDLSEALIRDLGGNNTWHSEERLRRQLKDHQSVGYLVGDKEEVNHVGLVSLPESTTRRRKLRTDM